MPLVILLMLVSPRLVVPVLSGAVLVLVASLLSTPALAQSGAPSPVPDSAFEHVDRLRTDGKFRDALSRLEDLRGQYGDDVDILWRMSLVRVNIAKTTNEEQEVKKQYGQALELADQALARDSSAARAHHAKAVAEGRIALDAGTRERVERSRAVKRHADRAIALDSTLDGPYHVRGRWNREVADLGILQRAVVRAVYGGLPEASFEQAVKDFKQAIALHDERLHRLELAKTYMKMDRPEEAKKELRALLELAPRGPFDQGYGNQAKQLLKGSE